MGRRDTRETDAEDKERKISKCRQKKMYMMETSGGERKKETGMRKMGR